MEIFGINGWELIIILLVAVVVLGPERLPHYAARLAQGVRDLRRLADGARESLREQMGPEFDSIDWKQYDPRQYDPRRIVREALQDEPDETVSSSPAGDPARPRRGYRFDPTYTPVDPDAT